MSGDARDAKEEEVRQGVVRRAAKAAAENASRRRLAEQQLAEYKELSATLADLPTRLSYNIMVPLSTKGFMQGRLIHTNEVTVLLGENYFLKCAASHAASIAARRADLLSEQLRQLQADGAALHQRLQSLSAERTSVAQGASTEQASSAARSASVARQLSAAHAPTAAIAAKQPSSSKSDRMPPKQPKGSVYKTADGFLEIREEFESSDEDAMRMAPPALPPSPRSSRASPQDVKATVSDSASWLAMLEEYERREAAGEVLDEAELAKMSEVRAASSTSSASGAAPTTSAAPKRAKTSSPALPQEAANEPSTQRAPPTKALAIDVLERDGGVAMPRASGAASSSGAAPPAKVSKFKQSRQQEKAAVAAPSSERRDGSGSGGVHLTPAQLEQMQAGNVSMRAITAASSSIEREMIAKLKK